MSTHPSVQLKRIKGEIKDIQRSIGAENQPSPLSQFVNEIFDVINPIMPKVDNFSDEANRLIGKPWHTHRDQILNLEVELYSIEAGNRANGDPLIKGKLDDLAIKYNMKVSSILPSFKD